MRSFVGARMLVRLDRTAKLEWIQDASDTRIGCANRAILPDRTQRNHLAPMAGLDWVCDRVEAVLAKGTDGRVIVEVVGADRMSNPFYRVHPRRNDRLIAPTEALVKLYPEVDFVDFAFVGEMLAPLEAICPARFAEIAKALRRTWLERMLALVDALKGRAVIDRTTQGSARFVTHRMVDRVAVRAAGLACEANAVSAA